MTATRKDKLKFYKKNGRLYKGYCGASNDFVPVKTKKKNRGKSKYYLYMEERHKKMQEEQAKITIKLDQTYQKEIYQETFFPDPAVTKNKKDIKSERTQQKRLEVLIKTEQYWPYAYKDLKDFEGKIVKVNFYIKDKWGNDIRTIGSWEKSSLNRYDSDQDTETKTRLLNISREINTKKQYMFGMSTGFVIIEYNAKTGKPKQVVAAQVLFNEKLYYVDMGRIEIKNKSRICCLV